MTAAPSKDARGSRGNRYLPGAAAGVTVLAGLGVLLADYGFKDDYTLLWQELHGENTAELGIGQGRPVAAALQAAGWAVVEDVSGLRWLRLVALLMIGLTVALLVHAMRRWGYGLAATLVVSAGFVALPTTAIMASWAIFFFSPVALALAVTAILVLIGNPREPVRLRNAAAAAAVLSMAVLTYQPAAMLFWPLLFLALVSPSRRQLERGAPVRETVLGATTCVVALLVGFLSVKAAPLLMETGTSGRSAFVTDPLNKMKFFFGDVLPYGFFPWALELNRLAGVVAGLVTALLLVLLLRGPILRRFAIAAAGLTAVALGWTANLPIAENSSSLRTSVAVMAGAVMLIGVVVQALAERAAPGGARTLLTTSALVMAAIAVASFSFRLQTYAIDPSTSEWRDVQRVSADAAQQDAPVLVLPAQCSSTRAPKVVSDELGVPGTCVYWAVEAMTELAYRERAGAWPAPDLFQYRGDAEYNAGTLRSTPPPGRSVLDYDRLLRGAPQTTYTQP